MLKISQFLNYDFIWKITGALWHHKVEEEDALKLIESVAKVAKDDVKERLAKLGTFIKLLKILKCRDYQS